MVNSVTKKVKDLKDAHTDADAEWNAIMSMWQGPPEDAGQDVLFPLTFGEGKYHRTRQDADVADAEFGITLPGRRTFYGGPEGEVEIRAYRCPEAEARAIEQKVHDLAHGRLNVDASISTNRKRAFFVSQDTGRRLLTVGFHDGAGGNFESNKFWYGGGWLCWFRGSGVTAVESFPSKYSIEVGKRAAAPAKK